MIAYNTPEPLDKFYLSTDQNNIMPATWTTVQLDGLTLLSNEDKTADFVSHKITPTIAGCYYFVIAQLSFLSADAKVAAQINKNGLTTICKRAAVGDENGYARIKLNDIAYLTNTDYVQLQVMSPTGNENMYIQAGIENTYLSITRI